MSHIYTRFLFFVLFSLFVVEIFSPFSDPVGKLGAIFWIVAFLIIFLEALIKLSYIIKEFIINKAPFVLLTLAIFGTLILVATGNILNSNSETTQEIACMLDHYSKSEDFGFRETCLFDYPARQLLFPALPSLFFSRDIFFLNIGGAIFFLSGLVIFAHGLMKFFKKNENSDLICATLIACIFHFYYINWFLLAFEQSIFPLSFTLMGVGLFLSLSNVNYYKNLSLIGIIIGYLIFSYTTGLFSALAAIFALLYLFHFYAKGAYQKFFTLLIIMYSLFLTASSLFIRGDIHLSGGENENMSMIADLVMGITHITTMSLNTEYVNVWFYPIFIIGLIAPFFTKYKNYYLFAFIWIWGVFILSIISKGYAYYPIDFRLHRSIVIVPIFAFFVGGVLESFKTSVINKRWIILSLFLFLLISGAAYNINILNSKQYNERHRHISFILWLREKTETEILATGGKIMFDDFLLDWQSHNNHYTSIQDSLKYYMPGFTICPTTSCANNNLVIYYATNGQDPDSYMHYNTSIGIFTFNGDSIEILSK